METMVGLDQYAYKMTEMLMRLGCFGWSIEVNHKNNGYIITHMKYDTLAIKDVARVAFMCETYANSLIYAEEDNWLKPKWETEMTIDCIRLDVV